MPFVVPFVSFEITTFIANYICDNYYYYAGDMSGNFNKEKGLKK